MQPLGHTRRRISVLKVDTAVNTADVFTKHLPPERHRELWLRSCAAAKALASCREEELT